MSKSKWVHIDKSVRLYKFTPGDDAISEWRSSIQAGGIAFDIGTAPTVSRVEHVELCCRITRAVNAHDELMTALRELMLVEELFPIRFAAARAALEKAGAK